MEDVKTGEQKSSECSHGACAYHVACMNFHGACFRRFCTIKVLGAIIVLTAIFAAGYCAGSEDGNERQGDRNERFSGQEYPADYGRQMMMNGYGANYDGYDTSAPDNEENETQSAPIPQKMMRSSVLQQTTTTSTSNN